MIHNNSKHLHNRVKSPFEFVRFKQGMNRYNESDLIAVKNCRNKAYQQLMAFLYIDNVDKAMYGLLLTELQMQQ